jgi:uncharacterized membrane protein
MEKTRKELVKAILNKELENDDHEYLIDQLIQSPLSINVDKQLDTTIKVGDKVADSFTKLAGSWAFIISFSVFIMIWVGINIFYLWNEFDPYPFVLLNLILSCVAALQAPIIMMSQNRQGEKDRLRSENDYRVDLKSELILEDLHDKIVKLIKDQKELESKIGELLNK